MTDSSSTFSLLCASFFLFFTIAEALDTFMWRWAAFLVVFLFMLVLVAILALVGLKQVKGVKKPEKTIESVGELKTVIPQKGNNSSSARRPGMYT